MHVIVFLLCHYRMEMPTLVADIVSQPSDLDWDSTLGQTWEPTKAGADTTEYICNTV